MHIEEIEFENRVLISEEKYFEIASDFFRIHPHLRVINQRNQYFDSDDLKLRNLHMTLRIRSIRGQGAVLTLKTKGEKGDIELTQSLTYFQHHALVKYSYFPKGKIVETIRSMGIPLSDIKYQVDLLTRRMQIDKDGYNYCIDKNVYNGITDYNIEVEASSREEAKKIMDELGKKYQFDTSTQCKGKSTRALLSLKKEQ